MGKRYVDEALTQSFNSRGDSFSMLRDSYHPVEVAKEEKRDHNRNKHRDAITPIVLTLIVGGVLMMKRTYPKSIPMHRHSAVFEKLQPILMNVVSCCFTAIICMDL